MPEPEKYVPRLTKKKRRLFISLAVLLTFALALTASEFYLRLRLKSIRQSDSLESGLMRHDTRLGWLLSPDWQGYHRHHDFDVRYTTNAYGFRVDNSSRATPSGKKFAYVGDSFTFGFGVMDSETFVSLMNTDYSPGNTHWNLAVPGYSTDQEILLIEEKVFYYNPDVILLFVYLGNDLFDNQRPYPLQANRGKPFFEITDTGLVLKNVPVPFEFTSPTLSQKNLAQIIFGTDAMMTNPIAHKLESLALFRLLATHFYKPKTMSDSFDTRFSPPLTLFAALIDRLENECREKNVELKIVLMPGKSYVERPGSPSAQFQDYLREKIVGICRTAKLPVIDLAAYLRKAYTDRGKRWFYPHDGHLNPSGHRAVAAFLAEQIQ